MSHEIRTPMYGVLGMLDMVAEGSLGAQDREYLDTAQRSARLLLDVINDILDFSRIEAGALRLERIDFDVVRILDDVVALLSGQARRKGIALRRRVIDDLPRCLSGDPGRLNQVLLNLIGNAVKFTETGHVEVSVHAIAQTPQTARLHFAVTDSGIGMSEEAGKRLFKPFSQVDDSNSRRFGGSGLGLAISKQLVELMGGEIGFTSTPGQGSTFWFTAVFGHASGDPLGRQTVDALATAPAVPESDGTGKGRDTSAAEPDPRPRQVRLMGRVLLTEDNPVNQKVTLAMLRRLGLTADLARDGHEALEAIERERYDLVLMDCQMPGMDGFEATRLIREREGRHRSMRGTGAPLPIIALTANAMPEDRATCLDNGMDDYLSKPFDRAALVAVLSRWLGGAGRRPQEPNDP
jgi:CheY-like chemotaxis protein